MGVYRILAVSDTHVPTIAQRLPEKIFEEARSCDLIIHAGDPADGDLDTTHSGIMGTKTAYTGLIPEVPKGGLTFDAAGNRHTTGTQSGAAKYQENHVTPSSA